MHHSSSIGLIKVFALIERKLKYVLVWLDNSYQCQEKSNDKVIIKWLGNKSESKYNKRVFVYILFV